MPETQLILVIHVVTQEASTSRSNLSAQQGLLIVLGILLQAPLA